MAFAIATGHARTTGAAEAVLAAGGTAADACIAAACMAFVAEPVLAQPLGGGFLMVVPEAGSPTCLDAFVQTPLRQPSAADLDLATVTVDFGTESQDFHIGAGTVAAPCLMPALAEAHRRFGRVPWPELVAPATAAARAGISVTPFQATVARLVAPILTADPALAAILAPGAKPPAAGDGQRNPDLADVLEVFAAEGPRFVTEGEVGQALAALPGTAVTAADLKAAAPVWRRPLALTRAGHDIALNPPPSLGGVQIAMLLSALPAQPAPATVARALAEVARLRRDLDLDAAPEEAAHRALAPAALAGLRDALARPQAVRGTTHISVAAPDGSGAALTLSNGEGCGRLLPGTGIQPNNMLGEEDLVPGGPTAWAPDRRLASMMCPTAMRGPDGALTLLGSGGSNRIRSAIATTILALIDQGLSPEAAVAAPRMHVEGDRLSFEAGDEARRAALLSFAPEATVWDAPHMYFGGVHVAQSGPSGARAAADPRRDGAAVAG